MNPTNRPSSSAQSSLVGLVLLNLGTPEDPSTPAVRRYLKEFLMDPDVVDIHPWLRWLLVHGIILPRRSSQSAALYQTIWTDRGSPLLVHLEDLVHEVRQEVQKRRSQGSPDQGPELVVVGAMRYATPSIRQVFEQLRDQGISRVVVFPLYPQYSLAATESSIKKCREQFA
ncbi:MAG: ferrochelatase, partial [Bdellovibrionia bacterium]